MNIKEKQDFYIDYGELSTEDENFIVGDKKGLQKLKNAIDEAIETGKSTKELDAFYGIICYDKDYFQNKKEYKPTLFQKAYGYISGILIITIVFSGIYTIFKWIF